MTTRKYTSLSQQTTLTGTVTSGATIFPVNSASSLLGGITLAANEVFGIVIDPDTALEEIVDLTSTSGNPVSANNLTVVRGVDGSSPQGHSAGAIVRHMIIGRDLREPNTHANTSLAVHGIAATSYVVGTIDAQSLSNKTIDMTGATLTGLSSSGMSASSAAPKSYVDSILGSATAASTSASSAATSATSAAASATAAATSATSAEVFATSASINASSALTSQTAAATSATSAAASATAATTSATSSAASSTAAATSATSAATQATAAATSATSAAASATAAATSATSAAASEATIDATATLAVEFRQYGAEGSVLQNVPTRVHPAETLLKQAVWWIDSAHSSSSGQAIKNLGWGGSALDATAGSTTAADSNDPQYLAWYGINYVYLPGTVNDYLSIPDASSLDLIGDIDLRAQLSMDDWTPTTEAGLVSKWTSVGNQRAYGLALATNGTLLLYWSSNGTASTSVASTVATGITDGVTKWVRVTLDVDNGASGNDVKFFTSDDGATWTQLGSTVTTAGIASIYSSTATANVGAFTPASSGPLAAKIYRAQILNGIDGVPVLDVDTSVVSTGAATSFTALTGQTVTINRSTSGRKTTCVTHPVWLFGTDDYMEVNNRWLEHAAPSANYVRLNGTSGNYLSSPDAAALDVVGDIDIRCQVALDDWTPSSANSLVAKFTGTGNQRSYQLRVNTDGTLFLGWSTTGSDNPNQSSTAATGFTDGATRWVRATLTVNNGAAGYDVKFYTSTDAVTWTQLGTTITGAGVTSIYAGTAIMEVGSRVSGTDNLSLGNFYRAQVYNGIAGTLVFDADASIITDGTASTFKERSSNAATVTINKSGTGTFASTNSYLYLPGAASNYASAPDSAAVSITGDIDIRCKVALDDWTPATQQALVSKWNTVGNNLSYTLFVQGSGVLQFQTSSAGTATTVTATSTAATGVADGATKWVRVTMKVDNGATGNTVTFYTSDDGSAWTQLGSAVTTAGVTSIFDGTALVEVGSLIGGTVYPSRGKFFRAQVLNGIAGTVAFDANFESSIVGNLPTTFTEGSTNAATVTVNYSGTAYRSAGVIASTYVFPGATNTFKLSSYSMLDFGASDDFTVVGIVRNWATLTDSQRIMSKGTVGYGSYSLQIYTSKYLFQIDDTVNYPSPLTASTITSGALSSVVGVKNVTADTLGVSLNGSALTTLTDTTVAFRTGYDSFRIGRNISTGSQYLDGEFVSAAVFRRVLTAGEITTLNSYFQGRVA